MKKDDVTLNMSHVTTETKGQLQQYVEEMKVARAEVETFNNDIAAKVCALCNGWIDICSDLQGVSIPIMHSVVVVDPGFPRGGDINRKGWGDNLLFWPIFPKICMKVKNF